MPASVLLLTSLFNTCLLNSRFPDSWKQSNTILLPKRGDASLPGNWRPISQQPTVYKIFTAVMAKRLAVWATLEKKISPAQKGFLPVEGCFEHSFLMESLMCDAKRRRKDVHILWLDLRNVFGSFSHELLWFMMNRLQVPTPFIDLCKSIYAGSSQRVRCGEGFTDDIPVNVGIKQGCPLSPFLFNLALEALLPALDRATSGYSMETLSVIKARFSCILVNFTCRFEDSPSVPERSYEQSVDILGYYYASISHVSTNYPLNFYTLSIDNSFMKVLKNAKSEMPTMFHSILPSKLPMGRMLLQCPNTSMKG